MCTAVVYRAESHYFGRNFDLESSFHECVTVTPRLFPLSFRAARALPGHFALIGMAAVEKGYPLYYDAMNEKGLCMAGLNFPRNAVYFPPRKGRNAIAPFELIPFLLGQCAAVDEAEALLRRCTLSAIPFSRALPLSPLHWLLCDKKRALVVEPTKEGLQLYENGVGVLTNNPPFPLQMIHLSNYMNLTREAAQNRLAPEVPLEAYSRGMGAMGLPGDLSSASRFVRAAFTLLNATRGESAEESVGQVFHILSSVAQTRGCVHLGEGRFESTRYAACCDAARGIYYYTSYENRQLCAVDLRRENLNGSALSTFPLLRRQQVRMQN